MILKSQISKERTFYTSRRLALIIFGVGLFFITVNNFISFVYNQNYFVFSEVDAGVYHNESIIMSMKYFQDSVYYFLDYWALEDLGSVLIISSLYRIIASNLIVNLFYLGISIFTGLAMFRIAQYLMQRKYAYYSALTFSISSFYIWFNSSGLKESIMIFLTIQAFLQYYHFMNSKSLKYIFSMLPFLLALMLFRPAIVFLFIGSILLAFMLGRKRSIIELSVVLVLITGLIINYSYLDAIINRFIGIGGVARMIEIKELDGMVKGSVQFTYMVNILAGLIGPLPTLLPNTKPLLSFYAPGLIYKSLISVPFWLGIITVYRRNIFSYYPIALFVILESASLILILEGLELRKSLPHFPFIYLVSFGFMSYLDSVDFFNSKRRKRIYFILNTSFVGIFLLILYWNFRF
ncbi:hypothetical protein N9263_00295 [Candidatus Marinimicrobia bacterium]|nr:hypothetical protein [Candidatus Neomarinimicrobiota bacterium]